MLSFGLSTLCHRSEICLVVRPGRKEAINFQLFGVHPYSLTLLRMVASSWVDHRILLLLRIFFEVLTWDILLSSVDITETDASWLFDIDPCRRVREYLTLFGGLLSFDGKLIRLLAGLALSFFSDFEEDER